VPKDRRVTDTLLVLGESKLPAARPTLSESSNRDGAVRLHGGRRHVLIERRLRYPNVAADLDISDASLDDTSIDETNSNLQHAGSLILREQPVSPGLNSILVPNPDARRTLSEGGT
jgi:hypothetical protein